MKELIPYVTDATFDAEVMQASLPVLVCFGNTNIFNTFPSLMLDLEEITKEYAGRVNVVKLNADENQQTWEKFNLSFIPSLSLFINGTGTTWKGAKLKLKISAFIDVLIKIKKEGLGEQRKRFELWILNRRNRSDEAESIKKILLIADACDAAIACGKLTDEQLNIIVDGGSSAYAMQWDPTIDLVVALHKKGVDVTSVLRELFKSKKANARWAALSCIQNGAISLPITDEILVAALADKSSKVSGMAAQVATCTFRKLWLLPLLEKIAKKDPTETPIMEFYIKLLRDGYSLTRNQNGSYTICFVSQGVLLFRDVSEIEFNTKGIDVILAELIRINHRDNEPIHPALVEKKRTLYAA